MITPNILKNVVLIITFSCTSTEIIWSQHFIEEHSPYQKTQNNMPIFFYLDSINKYIFATRLTTRRIESASFVYLHHIRMHRFITPWFDSEFRAPFSQAKHIHTCVALCWVNKFENICPHNTIRFDRAAAQFTRLYLYWAVRRGFGGFPTG